MNINRTLVNIIIDLIAALFFIGMLATGYLLRFPLPPGTNNLYTLWGLTRHQWGDIHFWISLGLILVMIGHLILHWNWIVTVIGKKCSAVKSNQPSLVRCATWTVVVFAGLCIGFAWVAEMNVKQIERPTRTHLDSAMRYAAVNSDPSAKSSNQSDTHSVVWADVYPIFETKCLVCHGPGKQRANFRVDLRQDFVKHDNPWVLPGQSAQSPLMAIISGERAEMAEMHKLSPAEVLLVKTWIDQGAE